MAKLQPIKGPNLLSAFSSLFRKKATPAVTAPKQQLGPIRPQQQGPIRPPAQKTAQVAAATKTPIAPTRSFSAKKTPTAPIRPPVVAPVAPIEPVEKIPSALQSAREAFAATGVQSEQEKSLQRSISRALEREELGLQDISEQAIPQGLLVGQQAALQRQAAIGLTPLQRQLGLLQEQRTAERGVAEAGVKTAEGVQEQLQGLAQSVLQAGGSTEQVNQILQSDDVQGALAIASESGVLAKPEELNTQIVEAGGQQVLVNTQTGEIIKSLGATPASLKRAQKSKEKEAAESSPFLQQLGDIATETIIDITSRISNRTVGRLAKVAVLDPESEASDFKVDLETLKADIGFGVLQQMREASKTGGALGQVSEIELALLQGTLGGINQFQSEENLRKNLVKVQKSIDRWTAAVQENADAVQTGGGSQEEIDFLNTI